MASRALQRNSSIIARSCDPSDLALDLYASEIIDDATLSNAINHDTPQLGRVIALMLEVKKVVKERPSCFDVICDLLEGKKIKGADSLKGIIILLK